MSETSCPHCGANLIWGFPDRWTCPKDGWVYAWEVE